MVANIKEAIELYLGTLPSEDRDILSTNARRSKAMIRLSPAIQGHLRYGIRDYARGGASTVPTSSDVASSFLGGAGCRG